jgi:hypothetical protein
MKPLSMKSLLLVGALTCAATTACVAQTYSGAPTYSGYWVVGNGAAHSCEIVTSNPVIEIQPRLVRLGPLSIAR